MSCNWCHNPESISPLPQVQWFEDRCIGCETCLEACPSRCLTMTDLGVKIDRVRCSGCVMCANVCPANALELLGKAVTLDELVYQVCKDRVYYETSAGGVTASGGEPVMQAGFVAAFFARLKALGVSTALDTCGLVSRKGLERILPHVDLVLFDLKEIDTERHNSFTGKGNEAILRSLLAIRDYMSLRSRPVRLWIRTPLIPGTTATSTNLLGLGTFIAQNLNGIVERWDLCAFNNLCRDKYLRLGLKWQYADVPLLAASELSRLEDCAKASGVDPGVIFATGATSAD